MIKIKKRYNRNNEESSEEDEEFTSEEEKTSNFNYEKPINNIEEAIAFVKSTFTTDSLPSKFPTIVWKHQLYPLMRSPTQVDISLGELCNQGSIRFLKLGKVMDECDTALILFDDYVEYVKSKVSNPIVDIFIKNVVPNIPSMIITTNDLKKYLALGENAIKELIRLSVLTNYQTHDTYLLSLPYCGQFYKKCVNGRKGVISSIRRSKYREIYVNDIKARKLPKSIQLGIEYHILDLLGLNEIKMVDSPTGTLIRLRK